MSTIDIENVNVSAFDTMPAPEEVHARLPLSLAAAKTVMHGRDLLRLVLELRAAGVDRRHLDGQILRFACEGRSLLLDGKQPLSGALVIDLSPATADDLNINAWDGVAIAKMKRGSISDRVGFEAGDIIVKVNDKDITSAAGLADLMAATPSPWRCRTARGISRRARAKRASTCAWSTPRAAPASPPWSTLPPCAMR